MIFLAFARALVVAGALSFTAVGAAHAQGAGMTYPALAEPGPERPGDRALSCEQIGMEIASIFRKYGIDRDLERTKVTACGALGAAGQPALDPRQAVEQQRQLAAASAPMLRAMQDPRVARLLKLGEEKHCAERVRPDSSPVEDPCAGRSPDRHARAVPPHRPPRSREARAGGAGERARDAGEHSGDADERTRPRAAPAGSAAAGDPFAPASRKAAPTTPSRDPFER